MNKRVRIYLIIALVLILALAVPGYFTFSHNNENRYSSGGGEAYDPFANLSVEEIAEQFNEDFVNYLLLSIGVQKLHNPILSSSTPKMQIEIDEITFGAEVVKGGIKIRKGDIEGEDIIIRTSRLEGAKMIKDRSYIKESFSSGNSAIELIAGKAELFSKGYLGIYEQFQ